MLIFYYTRNLLPRWIMIYYSKQFDNYAYPIYALRTGFFSNCWIYFIFLNLKYIEVESYMNKWLRSSWCLICNVTIKSSCYKIGQILVKHLVIFLNLFFMAVIVQMSDLTQSVFFLSKKPWKSPTHPWVVKDRYL